MHRPPLRRARCSILRLLRGKKLACKLFRSHRIQVHRERLLRAVGEAHGAAAVGPFDDGNGKQQPLTAQRTGSRENLTAVFLLNEEKLDRLYGVLVHRCITSFLRDVFGVVHQTYI